MTDLQLRWLSGSRAGGQDDYDVIVADGLVIRPHADARLRADARGGHVGTAKSWHRGT
jgi:hypothetical protein